MDPSPMAPQSRMMLSNSSNKKLSHDGGDIGSSSLMKRNKRSLLGAYKGEDTLKKSDTIQSDLDVNPSRSSANFEGPPAAGSADEMGEATDNEDDKTSQNLTHDPPVNLPQHELIVPPDPLDICYRSTPQSKKLKSLLTARLSSVAPSGRIQVVSTKSSDLSCIVTSSFLVLILYVHLG